MYYYNENKNYSLLLRYNELNMLRNYMPTL